MVETDMLRNIMGSLGVDDGQSAEISVKEDGSSAPAVKDCNEEPLPLASWINAYEMARCAFPNCTLPKHGNQDKCLKHRRDWENATNDCPEEDLIKLQAMSHAELEELFEARRTSGAGPPGRGHKRKKTFDYGRFFQERKSTTFQSGQAKVKPVGHWSFKKHMKENKNWPEDMADKEWWNMVKDKERFKFRDFDGDEICPCGIDACCGGKLRLKVKVDEFELIGRRMESTSCVQTGFKDKRSPTDGFVQALYGNLVGGHASFEDTMWDPTGGSSLARLAQIHDSDDFQNPNFEVVLEVASAPKKSKGKSNSSSASGGRSQSSAGEPGNTLAAAVEQPEVVVTKGRWDPGTQSGKEQFKLRAKLDAAHKAAEQAAILASTALKSVGGIAVLETIQQGSVGKQHTVPKNSVPLEQRR
jgi:hypothetical protein